MQHVTSTQLTRASWYCPGCTVLLPHGGLERPIGRCHLLPTGTPGSLGEPAAPTAGAPAAPAASENAGMSAEEIMLQQALAMSMASVSDTSAEAGGEDSMDVDDDDAGLAAAL